MVINSSMSYISFSTPQERQDLMNGYDPTAKETLKCRDFVRKHKTWRQS